MGRAPHSRADWQLRLNIGGARRDVFHFTRGPGAAQRGEHKRECGVGGLDEDGEEFTQKARFPDIEGRNGYTGKRIPGLSSSWTCEEKESAFFSTPRSPSCSRSPSFTSSSHGCHFSSSKKDARADFADLLRVRPPAFLTGRATRAKRTGIGGNPPVPAHPRTFRNLREEQLEKQKQEIIRILRAPTKNHPWGILKLPQPKTIRDASSDLAITRQFRLLSRLCHPDKVPRALNDQATKAFQILERAVQEARKFNQERKPVV